MRSFGISRWLFNFLWEKYTIILHLISLLPFIESTVCCTVLSVTVVFSSFKILQYVLKNDGEREEGGGRDHHKWVNDLICSPLGRIPTPETWLQPLSTNTFSTITTSCKNDFCCHLQLNESLFFLEYFFMTYWWRQYAHFQMLNQISALLLRIH